MSTPLDDFAEALLAYVEATLQGQDLQADYCHEAVRIVDAHNHLFVGLSHQSTDEQHSIYALRDLCSLDETSMELRPDRWRCLNVGRDCGLK